MSWRIVLLGGLALGACTSSLRETPPRLPSAGEIARIQTPQAFALAEGRLREGVLYSRVETTGDAAMVAHILEIDLTEPRFHFAMTPADRSRGMEHRAKLTSAMLEEANALVAVNASYFLPFAGGTPGGDDFYPQVGDPVNVSGAEMAGGQIISPVETDLDIRVNAIVCFTGLRITIEDGQVCPDGVLDGVAAGPRLLATGQRRSFLSFDNNYAATPAPRSAIGLSPDRRTAWIVVVDGRQKEYSVGASLNQLTDIFIELGANDAINLDGGGSSTLVVADAAGAPVIVNRPIHSGVPGRERPVANHVLLLPGANETSRLVAQ